MTEKEQDALPVVEQEPEKKPLPDVSGGSPEAGSAPVGPDISKKLEAIEETLAKLPDMIDARVKSTKDKRFQDLERIKQYLDEAKGDPKLAARNMVLDEMVQGEAQVVQPGAPGRATEEDVEARTAKFLNDLKDESGIELSDEELEQIWRGKRYTNYDDAFRDARKAAWKKAKQANIGAGVIASQPGGQASSEDVEEIAKELRDIQGGKRGSPISPENKKRRAELKEKLAKARS